MDCRIVRVEQGSDEWLALRRGRITASRLADVMAKPNTKRYQGYRREIVLELLGHENQEDSPEWARHGRENEPRAIAGYEWKYNVDVEHDVFLIHNEFDWLGASPDLLHKVEDADDEYDEGGEIKCRALFKNYKARRTQAKLYEGMAQAIPACDRHQVQGNMLLTGWRRWWYIDYYIGDDLEGGLTQKIHRVAVKRDQKLIDQMIVRSLKFMRECYEMAGRDPDIVSNYKRRQA